MTTPLQKPAIAITRADYERLDGLLAGLSPERQLALAGLQEELDRAELLDALPPGLVCMGARVRFANDTTGEVLSRRLVYPAEAMGDEGAVSILTPAGSALLGLAEGQCIEWPVPGGRSVRLRILEVEQPG